MEEAQEGHVSTTNTTTTTKEKKVPKKSSKKKSTDKGDDGYGVSRGIDFKGVNFVINFDFPLTAAAYTHRIGRTARGNASGTALSFVAKVDPKEVLRVELEHLFVCMYVLCTQCSLLFTSL